MIRIAALFAAGLLSACTIAPRPIAPVAVGADRFRHADAVREADASLAEWPAWFGA
ncbi:RND transporter, partial [Burkholderia territorii]